MASISVASPEKSPKLRQHVSGQYFLAIPKQLGGGTRWLGRDIEAAKQKYLGIILDLQSRLNYAAHKLDSASKSENEARQPAVTRLRSSRMVASLIDEFIQTRISDLEEISKKNWIFRLKKFKEEFGEREIHSLTPRDLDRFRISLKDYAPTFSFCILNHVKAFLIWCYESGVVNVPFRLGALKPYRAGPTKSKALPPAEVAKIIQRAYKANQQVGRGMLLQFLCTLRPSELPRLVWSTEQPTNGVIHIHSKTSRKTGALRPVLITPEAEELIREIKQTVKDNPASVSFRSFNGYRLACLKYAGRSPHFLRHSSAQALSDAGVREEFIRVAMGRTMARVDRVYISKPNYQEAIDAVSVLTKFVSLR